MALRPKALAFSWPWAINSCWKIFNDYLFLSAEDKQESRAVARKPRDAAAVLFWLKFADDIHYKFKSSRASKAMLQSSKHTGTKQNLTQNGGSRSFKVTCFGVSGKAIRQLLETKTKTLALWSRDQDRDLRKMNSSALESRDLGLEITTLVIRQ